MKAGHQRQDCRVQFEIFRLQQKWKVWWEVFGSREVSSKSPICSFEKLTRFYQALLVEHRENIVAAVVPETNGHNRVHIVGCNRMVTVALPVEGTAVRVLRRARGVRHVKGTVVRSCGKQLVGKNQMIGGKLCVLFYTILKEQVFARILPVFQSSVLTTTCLKYVYHSLWASGIP